VARGAQNRQNRAGSTGRCPVSARDGEYCLRLGAGQRIQQCVSNGNWPDGVAGAGLSVDCGGDVQVVWSFYGAGFFCLRCAEHTFFFGGLRADFLCGETDWRIGSGGGSGVALGSFSERGDDAVRVDLGYVAVGVAGRFDLVGDFGVGGIGKVAGLGRVRNFVGSSANDESIAGFAAATLTWLGGIPRPRRKPLAVETGRTGGWPRGFVLLAVDRAQLRRFSSVHSGALKFAV